jgi:hypothetical protein
MKRGSATGPAIKIARPSCGATRSGIRQRPVRLRAFENMGQRVPPRVGCRRERPATAEPARVISVMNPGPGLSRPGCGASRSESGSSPGGAWRDTALALASASGLRTGRMEV